VRHSTPHTGPCRLGRRPRGRFGAPCSPPLRSSPNSTRTSSLPSPAPILKQTSRSASSPPRGAPPPLRSSPPCAKSRASTASPNQDYLWLAHNGVEHKVGPGTLVFREGETPIYMNILLAARSTSAATERQSLAVHRARRPALRPAAVLPHEGLRRQRLQRRLCLVARHPQREVPRDARRHPLHGAALRLRPAQPRARGHPHRDAGGEAHRAGQARGQPRARAQQPRLRRAALRRQPLRRTPRFGDQKQQLGAALAKAGRYAAVPGLGAAHPRKDGRLQEPRHPARQPARPQRPRGVLPRLAGRPTASPSPGPSPRSSPSLP
jgi:hypothetical protein